MLCLVDDTPQAVSALAFSPDGCFLYSGGEDAMVSSWNMLAAVDPDGGEAFKVLASAVDKTVRSCWNVFGALFLLDVKFFGIGVDAIVGGGEEEGDAFGFSSFFPPSCYGTCLKRNLSLRRTKRPLSVVGLDVEVCAIAVILSL